MAATKKKPGKYNFKNKQNIVQLAEELSKTTHFSKRECESILHMNPVKEKLFDRTTFRDILHVSFGMTDDMLMDRVFRAFDKDADSYVSCNEWVQGLSVFLRGNMDEKIKYCFDVYDLNNDGSVSREEMFHMLKNCLVKPSTEEDPDEGVKDLVELTLKKLDMDHDGKVTFNDYRQAVEKESALLEVFGQCLPSPQTRAAFLELIKDEKITN